MDTKTLDKVKIVLAMLIILIAAYFQHTTNELPFWVSSILFTSITWIFGVITNNPFNKDE